MKRSRASWMLIVGGVVGCCGGWTAQAAPLGYVQTNLVANGAEYHPQILDPTLQNGWGIAIRPAGFGGHFWISSNANGTSNEYVGDVGGVPLFQDNLKLVTVPGPAGSQGTPTGVVFNPSGNFVITQEHPNGPITNAGRFLFVTDSGTLSAWTERQNADGTFDRPGEALVKVDRSGEGVQYFGLAISPASDRLFAANFGASPGIHVYDSTFGDVTGTLAGTVLVANPFAADGFQPFNVQGLGTSLFVAYAKLGTRGEEETGPGLGRIAEFDFDGNLLATWDGGDYLNAPWGLVFAPADFGRCSQALLVSNFGDGTIACLDPATLMAFDYLRDLSGDPIVIEGIWGLVFGNGASLGRADALYFAAGPRDETDGLFGRITVATPQPNPAALLAVGLAGAVLGSRWRRRPRTNAQR